MDAIAVMRIKVDIEYLSFTGSQHMSNGHSNVVIHTKAGGAICPGVMKPTSRMKYVKWSLAL